MNFEEAFRNYKEGVATDEEREYVESEIAKARALASILEDDSISANAAIIKEADDAEIKAIKKEFSWRKMMIALITMVAVIVLVGVALGIVFGVATDYASKAVAISKEEALEYAIEAAYADATNVSKWGDLAFDGENTFTLDGYNVDKEIDRDLVLSSNIKDTHYVYEVDVVAYTSAIDSHGRSYLIKWEYEIRVDSRNGSCTIIDFDVDRE